MKMLAAVVVALVLVGVTGAYAQIVYPGPLYPGYTAPPVVVAPLPPPIVVAPSPYIAESYPYSAIVNPYTGRWCTFEPSGYRWCWTP
jgi:hypothetical protein